MTNKKSNIFERTNMILLFVWLLSQTMAADAGRKEHKRSFYDGADGSRILLKIYKNSFFIPAN